MDQVHLIRLYYYGQSKSLAEISRIMGLDWRTVRKYVDQEDFNPPSPKPASEIQFCPKLDPYKPLIDQWLSDDKKAPRKQRHTAKRVFNRLTKEAEGFDCSYRLVAEYVSARKKELNLSRQEGYIPLSHCAGEAQGDFGTAKFFENGKEMTGKYFVLSFPYSNAGYPQLHYGENLECLLESMDAIFRHIGGVPSEIWFDNTSTIVQKILRDGGRETTEKFNLFADHYGFRSIFCNPDSGNEKGNVENKVGYSRRNYMVPIPHFVCLEDYNKQLLKDFDEDLDREHYRKDAVLSELFEEDRKELLPLPRIPFDLRSHKTAVTNGWGKFSLDKGKHIYSVSPDHANQSVNLYLTSTTVTVLDGDFHEIVSHRRLYGDQVQESMEWLPYLRAIARKPRSLRNSGIYDMMPGNMQRYMDRCMNSDRGRILKVLSELTERTGFDSAMQTVNQAILYQANDPDSLKNLYRKLYMDVPDLPPIHGSNIPKVIMISPDLAQYDALLKGGAAHEG